MVVMATGSDPFHRMEKKEVLPCHNTGKEGGGGSRESRGGGEGEEEEE